MRKSWFGLSLLDKMTLWGLYGTNAKSELVFLTDLYDDTCSGFEIVARNTINPGPINLYDLQASTRMYIETPKVVSKFNLNVMNKFKTDHVSGKNVIDIPLTKDDWNSLLFLLQDQIANTQSKSIHAKAVSLHEAIGSKVS